MIKNGTGALCFVFVEIKPTVEPEEVSYLGLVNEGTTCYVNSLLQTLFFIRQFRNAIYRVPTVSDDGEERSQKDNEICYSLQKIFFNLEQTKNDQPVRTCDLLAAFGFDERDFNQQQDVDEFNNKLSDQLEQQMMNTEVAGTYNRLFQGESQTVIKCVDVDFESARNETFATISLNVKGQASIEQSIREYVAAEDLNGDNQYDTEVHGKQDAKRSIRFKKLPPVLQVSLNRYNYDL